MVLYCQGKIVTKHLAAKSSYGTDNCGGHERPCYEVMGYNMLEKNEHAIVQLCN